MFGHFDMGDCVLDSDDALSTRFYFLKAYLLLLLTGVLRPRNISHAVEFG